VAVCRCRLPGKKGLLPAGLWVWVAADAADCWLPKGPLVGVPKGLVAVGAKGMGAGAGGRTIVLLSLPVRREEEAGVLAFIAKRRPRPLVVMMSNNSPASHLLWMTLVVLVLVVVWRRRGQNRICRRGWRTLASSPVTVVRSVDGASSTTATSAALGSLVGSSHGRVEGGEVLHHLLVLILLVRVHRLRMLSQIVETRKLLATVAAEGSFPGMFPVEMPIVSNKEMRPRKIFIDPPNMTSQVLRTAEYHSAFSVTPTLECLCRGRAITFGDVGSSGRGGGHIGNEPVSDGGGHIAAVEDGLVWRGALLSLECDGVERGRGGRGETVWVHGSWSF
jgi:hypothetical protein